MNMPKNSTFSDFREFNSGSRWMGGFLEEVSLCKKNCFLVSCFSPLRSDGTDGRSWSSEDLVYDTRSQRG